MDYHEYALEKFAVGDWESKVLSDEVPEMHILSISEDQENGNYIVLVKYDEDMEDVNYLGWAINIPIESITNLETEKGLSTSEIIGNYLIYINEVRTVDETTTTDHVQPVPRDDLLPS